MRTRVRIAAKRATLREAIAEATGTLAEAGIDSARTDAELLAAHLAGIERGRLAMIDPPDADFFERFAEAVRRRSQRIPLQHITGTAPFGPVDLQVGPGVFIPRPETEAMLEWALAQMLPAQMLPAQMLPAQMLPAQMLPAQMLPDQPVIVDLCTGSGALAIALAASLPHAQVIGVDDDPSALAFARRNVDATGVLLVQGDVTDPELLSELAGSVDLVVANPPYIPADAELEPEVAQHDPAHALFGGPDGMAVIGPIAALAGVWLRTGGLLAVEHDDTTSARTVETICATGFFDEVTPHDDLTGRPRFVTARRQGKVHA